MRRFLTDAWSRRGRRREGDAEAPALPADSPELIVTGISRSGTSHLCNLLHRFDNCVAINEPREIVSLLRKEEVPVGVRAFFRKRRREILAGIPIENKLLDGEVVEDTALYQVRHAYAPAVAADDFVLAVKNTREFLLRLGAVRQVMPAARVVACVRDPFDTIASWKSSFPHLREADVGPFVRHRRRMWLPGEQRAALERIDATRGLAERRALWWRFLAERVLEHGDGLVLVDYDDLVAGPAEVLDRILRGYRPGSLRRPVAPSVARPRREVLDEDDRRAIATICSPVAADLGLSGHDRP